MNKIANILPKIIISSRSRLCPLKFVVVVIVIIMSTGCFRATGLQRFSVIAEMLPKDIEPDQVIGSMPKSKTGDYYLGNDFIHVAIAHSVANTDDPKTHMGNIIDAGYLKLNPDNYDRRSTSGNAMGRFSVVVNGNRNLPVIFDENFIISNDGDTATLAMKGSICDVKGSIVTAGSLVPGVSVDHKISLSRIDKFLTLETSITNNGLSPIEINSVGDYLVQEKNKYYELDIPKTAIGDVNLTSGALTPVVGFMDRSYNGYCSKKDPCANLWVFPLDEKKIILKSYRKEDITTPECHCYDLVISGEPKVNKLEIGCTIKYSRRMYILTDRITVNSKLVDVSNAQLFLDFIYGTSTMTTPVMDNERDEISSVVKEHS